MLATQGLFPWDDPFLQFAQNGSLESAWDDTDIWSVDGNLGFIGVLFDNPRYNWQFLDDGLRPADAYGCALNYLSAPSADMKRYFASELQVMSSNWLKVGIQIRLGDSHFDGEDTSQETLPGVKHFFNCAQELIDKYKQPQQNAIMFLMSDSLSIRQEAHKLYGEQLITKLEQPGHTAAGKHGRLQRAMIHAAGEHWLFGMADFHVISSSGSFGRSAALRSRRWHSVYTLDIGSSGEMCGGRPLDFDELARRPPFT